MQFPKSDNIKIAKRIVRMKRKFRSLPPLDIVGHFKGVASGHHGVHKQHSKNSKLVREYHSPRDQCPRLRSLNHVKRKLCSHVSPLGGKPRV